MGRNNTAWEDDAALLATVARSRARVIAAERQLDNAPACQVVHSMRAKLEQAWALLLTAQISDAFGWRASAQAVSSSQRASDQALLVANQVAEEAARVLGRDREPLDEMPLPPGLGELDAEGCASPQMFGVDGHDSVTPINLNVQLYECVFTSSASRFGVRFPFTMNEIVFCPSGLEKHPARVPLDRLIAPKPTLALANGLLQIGRDVFLIKHTLFVHVAAQIGRKQGAVEFAVEGSTRQRAYQWRFFVVKGTLEYAVTVANIVNGV
jgi:hypothetical protein